MKPKEVVTYYILALVVLIPFLSATINILREYERGVVVRLGRLLERPKEPGLVIIIPIIDRLVRGQSSPGDQGRAPQAIKHFLSEARP